MAKHPDDIMNDLRDKYVGTEEEMDDIINDIQEDVISSFMLALEDSTQSPEEVVREYIANHYV